jgi:hypothetical protein
LLAAADALVKHLLPPLLAGTHELAISPAAAGGSSSSSSSSAESSVQLQPSSGQQQPEAGLEALLQALGSRLLGGSHAAAAALGALLWPRLVAAYKERRLAGLEAAELAPEQVQVGGGWGYDA